MFKIDEIFEDFSTRNRDYLEKQIHENMVFLDLISKSYLEANPSLDKNELKNNYFHLFIAFTLSYNGSIKLFESIQYDQYVEYCHLMNKEPYGAHELDDYIEANPEEFSKILEYIFNLQVTRETENPKYNSSEVAGLSILLTIAIIAYFDPYFNMNGLIFLYNVELFITFREQNWIDFTTKNEEFVEYTPTIFTDKLDLNGKPLIFSINGSFILANAHQDGMLKLGIGCYLHNFSSVLTCCDIDVIINFYDDEEKLVTTVTDHINKITADETFYYGNEPVILFPESEPTHFTISTEVSKLIYKNTLYDDDELFEILPEDEATPDGDMIKRYRYIKNKTKKALDCNLSWVLINDDDIVITGGSEKNVSLLPNDTARITIIYDNTLKIKKTNVTVDTVPLQRPDDEPDIYYIDKVVGVKYGNRQNVISKLNLGDKLNFVIEPNNQYDDHAVRVETMFGEQIGYISKYKNQEIFDNIKNNLVDYIVKVQDIYDRGFDNSSGVSILIIGYKK